MTYILDASAAVEIALNRPKSTSLSDLLIQGEWIIAPDLFVSEVSNTFWKYHKFENLPIEICEKTLDMTLSLVDDFVKSYTLYKEAFAFACMTQHSVYDMLYLVLTRRHNGILITVDLQLIQVADKYSIRVNRNS